MTQMAAGQRTKHVRTSCAYRNKAAVLSEPLAFLVCWLNLAGGAVCANTARVAKPRTCLSNKVKPTRTIYIYRLRGVTCFPTFVMQRPKIGVLCNTCIYIYMYTYVCSNTYDMKKQNAEIQRRAAGQERTRLSKRCDYIPSLCQSLGPSRQLAVHIFTVLGQNTSASSCHQRGSRRHVARGTWQRRPTLCNQVGRARSSRGAM